VCCFFEFSIGLNHRLQTIDLTTLESPSNVGISICKQMGLQCAGRSNGSYLLGRATVATPGRREGSGY
jgi:hypothetical protein